MTACLGVKTRVETMVEIELAASCMPLVKSKTRAMRIMKMIKIKFKSTSPPVGKRLFQPLIIQL